MQVCLKKLPFLFSLLLFVKSANSQDVISLFLLHLRQEYSGYVEKNKEDVFEDFVRKVKLQEPRDTFYVLSKIISFFKDGHLAVYNKAKSELDTLSCNKTLLEVRQYLSNRKKVHEPYEGFWINDYNNCVIGLKKVNDGKWKYKGYVIESKGNILLPGSVVMALEPSAPSEYFTNYIDPELAFNTYVDTKFRSDSIFTTGAYGKWRKLKYYDKPILPGLPEFSLKASGRLLDKDNYLMVIPDNTNENGKVVDSIVKKDSIKIVSAKNLIVDIRNNLGGTIRTYEALFPFVYTNPINRVTGSTFSSDSSIAREERRLEKLIVSNPQDTGSINSIREFITQLKKGKGTFVSPRIGSAVIRFDYILPRPQNVAVLMNYACQSAAEIMVLNFLQSKKVKTFGECTKGVADHLSTYSFRTPDKKYLIYIPVSKRNIPAGGTALDGLGIKPDIPISDNVSDWVSFVKEYYDKN